MEMTKVDFYKFSDGGKNKNIWWADEMGFENSIICSKYGGHTRPGKRKEPLLIKFESPEIGDIMWTWFSECIVTDRIANLFCDAGFTGYRLEPVIVKNIKGASIDDLPKLWEMVITGKGGDIRDINSIEVKTNCEYCGHTHYTDLGNGLLIDENQWDGSDFFTVWPLPKYIIVTNRVKDFIINNQINNVKITKVRDLRGEGKKGGLSPGKYEDWLNVR
jgi:hypothetical protein